MSKLIFLITSLACLPLLCFCQPLNTWPTANSWWEMQIYDDNGNPTGMYIVRHLDGDTLIGGQTYQKVVQYWGSGFPTDYSGATRTDSSGLVYTVPKDSSSEMLLYDFTAQVGDTIRGVFSAFLGAPVGPDTVVVFSKDTINMLDGPHLRMNIIRPNLSGQEYWIDGVGTWGDFLLPEYLISVSGGIVLQCMTRQSVPVLQGSCPLLATDLKQSMNLEISPNPGDGLYHLRALGTSPATTYLHDIQGRLILQWEGLPGTIDLRNRPAGLYVLTVAGDGLQASRKLLKY